MLNGSMLGSLILSKMQSKGIKGTSVPNFSQALGQGIVESFLKTNKVVSLDTGIMSKGDGKGKLVGMMNKQLTELTYGLMQAQGFKGTMLKTMISCVSEAVCQHFMSKTEVITFHFGVAVGTGTGKILGINPNKMGQQIVDKMTSKNIGGVSMEPLAKSFAAALCTHLLTTAKLNITITGGPSPLPLPSAGMGLGKCY